MSAVSIEKQNGNIAVVTFAKEPVNTMDIAFWRDLLAAFETLEADKDVRAIIFQSGLKRNVFTAGLDIKELYAPNTNKERLTEFWTTLSTTLAKIYGSSKPTAAAIRGACPAGGCGLALCCDYRVITKDGSMGLNEVQLGIPVPKFWIELFENSVGHRQAEKLLLSGDMPSSPQLLQLGMVDKVVETSEETLPAALKEVTRWLKFPDSGRALTKAVLRDSLAERWQKGIAEEAGLVWTAISDPKTVASLTKVLQRLGGKPQQSKL